MKIRCSVSDNPRGHCLTVRACQFRASATNRGNSTRHPQDHHDSRLTAIYPLEVRPLKHPPARSSRRVRARRRGQFALQMEM
jgi:hypothetical protein